MTELPSTQLIRLVDVFALGPTMVFAAAKIAPKHQVLGAFLFISGLSTILFNGINFVRDVR